MVHEVTFQDPLKPRIDDWHGFVPSLVELAANRGQRCSHTLLDRESHDLELALLVCPATMREPERVERLRSALPPHAPLFRCKEAELDQARLVRVQ
jgi:hypothetical protein